MGARISAIPAGDKDWFYALLRRCVEAAGDNVSVRDVAREAMDRIEAVALSAELAEDRALAIRLLRALAEDGVRDHVDIILKEDRARIVVFWDGTEVEVNIPARVAIRDRQTRVWQHHYHDLLPRDTYIGYVGGLERTTSRQLRKLAAHQQNVALLHEYPAAQNVAEAQHLAGIGSTQMELAI